MAEEKKHTTLSGYELKRVYTEEDIKGEDLRAQLGDPGHYPFTRGIREEMYRDGRLWTMGQYAGFASAEEANKRFRYIIEQGGRWATTPTTRCRRARSERWESL